MRAAYQLASQSLPDHSSKFSRKDFTLPQLFACLVVKEQMRTLRGHAPLCPPLCSPPGGTLRGVACSVSTLA